MEKGHGAAWNGAAVIRVPRDGEPVSLPPHAMGGLGGPGSRITGPYIFTYLDNIVYDFTTFYFRDLQKGSEFVFSRMSVQIMD